MYHSIQRLSRHDTIIFLTDNAVGLSEEENLAHLTANLAGDVDPSRIVPFLTSKHSIEYCLMHASRAASHGFGALTVLGGDHTVGPPALRAARPRAALSHSPAGAQARPRRLGQPSSPGGRAGGLPAGRPVRGRVLPDPGGLPPQHPCRGAVSQGGAPAGCASTRVSSGCFSIGAPTPGTLARLADFFPVPAAELTREFEAGLTPEEICAKTVRALRDVGADKVYLSNLGFKQVESQYRRIVELCGKVSGKSKA